MQIPRRIELSGLGTGALFLLLLVGACYAQDKSETIQAIAHGQGNQMGMSIGVTVIIESYSTVEDQKTLWEAFEKGGNQGLLNALVKMPSRGRLLFAGVAEYELTYIREFPTTTGRKVRLVAKRPLAFGEARGYKTDSDYRLSAVELDLSPEKGKSKGIFLPACEFSVTQERGIEIAAYQNSWRLEDITDKNSK